MRKLPENVVFQNDNGEIISQPFAEWAKLVIKEKKIKPLKNEAGQETRSALDVVKALFTAHLNDSDGSYELPEEIEHLADASDFIRSQVQAHLAAVTAQKEQQNTEKQKKQQEKEATKAEKEKEDKEYLENQRVFAEFVIAQSNKHSKKLEENFKASINSLKLPSSIAISSNGMGLVVSESTSKQDLAAATAALLTGMEGAAAINASLQFCLGDVMNASVKAKIYRSKGDAAEAVKINILEATNKRYASGVISAYSLMAERVPAEKRRPDIAPSIYLEASKITAPRMKEGTAAEQEKLAKQFEKTRNEAIELINKGELVGVKDVKAHAASFKKSMGLLRDSAPGIPEIAKRLFMGLWIKENLTHVDETYTFSAGKDSPEVMTMPLGEVTDRITDAMNEFQAIFLKEYDIPALIKGTVKKGKGDNSTEEPYLLADPFGLNSK